MSGKIIGHFSTFLTSLLLLLGFSASARSATVPQITSSPTLLTPNANGGMFGTVTYDATTGQFIANGVDLMVNNPGGGTVSGGMGIFDVSAVINHSTGLANSGSGSLTVKEGSNTLFSSSNLIGFGILTTGTTPQYDFEFVQGSFSGGAPFAPPAGQVIGVVLNLSNITYAADGISITSATVSGDAAPVVPTPGSAVAGAALLLGCLGYKARRNLRGLFLTN